MMLPGHRQCGWEEITDETDQRVGFAELQGLQREHLSDGNPWGDGGMRERRDSLDGAPVFGGVGRDRVSGGKLCGER